MAGLLAAYDRLLTSSPLVTKTATSAVLFGLGDFMAQKLTDSSGPLDLSRLARMTAWGAIFTPFAHVWYAQLDKFVTGSGALVVAKKVALDQLTWTVAINIGFFWTTSFMETGDVYAGIAKIHDKLWPTLKVNWVVWPVLQAVNLSVVPAPYRILYINFASLFWSAYLSSQAAGAPPTIAPTPKQLV